jgi:hypothetical protein
MNPEDDVEPTAEELAEAEELARALERGHGTAPAKDLETAALLRYAKDRGALDPEKSQLILDDALARARPRAQKSSWRVVLFGALGLSAAAAAAFLVLQTQPAPGASTLPAPPRALLDAQIQATAAESASLEPLGAELQPYRVAVYSALREHYGR